MTLAIAILNWNGIKLLKKYLPTVVENSFPHLIYLIDNASTDESVLYVQQFFPEVKIIQHHENYGFANGYNLAIPLINAEIICLLNSDVRVTPNWISPVLQLFKNQPQTAIIQPKLLDDKNPTYFEYAGAAGGMLDALGYPYCRGRIFDTLEEDQNQYQLEASIFWASGAAFFIRKSIYLDLGGLDALYFAHHEEIDLCWRARNQGYEIKYCPSATVYHLGGGTLGTQHPHKTFLNFRNSLFNILKNLPLRKSLPIIFIRLILDGVAGVQFILQFKAKHTWAIIQAHLSFYYYFFHILKSKKSLIVKQTFYPKSIVFQYFIKKNRYYSKGFN